MDADLTADHAELERLQGELQTRASTLHFAQAGVATVAAIIFAGASGKLGWDARGRLVMILGMAAGVLALGLVGFALFHYWRGMRVLRHELSRFARFVDLRRQLGVDDPEMLLPR